MERFMIRDAALDDAARIAEIYAPYVLGTCISFEEKAPDEAEMRERIIKYSREYPYLALEEGGRVTGYAYASPFKARRAYAPTVEVSVYVDKALLGGGRGEALARALIERLKADARYYTAVACVTSPNARSEALFLRLGFRLAGVYERVGWKLGEWRSVVEYVMALKPYDTAPRI